MIERAPRSMFTNSRFVRSIRNASASAPCGSASITSRLADAELLRGAGMRASNGRPRWSADLGGADHARVQRLAQERERDAEKQSEDDSERGVPHRLRLYLDGRVRRAQERCVGGLQRLGRSQLLLVRDQLGEQRGVPSAEPARSSAIRPSSSLRAATSAALSSSCR